jgi:DNA-binding IclR family transcriptional regulator
MNRVGVSTNVALARRLDLKYSTAHRILMVLTDMGLVRHDKLGHQFVLAGGVRELAAGLRDTPFVEHALPRMRSWTRRHGLPLLLVTEDAGSLIVRGSTDAHWPVAGERCVAGSVLPARGSSEALIYAAFGCRADDRATSRTVRRQGYAKRSIGPRTEVHVSVPVISGEELVACLSLRCPVAILEARSAVPRWAQRLHQLATDIAAAHP